MFNEAFATDEVGRIYGTLSEYSQFANSEDAVNDYIRVLNEYHENKNQREAGSMSEDDLLTLAQKLKEKKSK